MSLTECEWGRYKGMHPDFPAEVRKLAWVLDDSVRVRLDPFALASACKCIPGFGKSYYDTLTSDDYRWFVIIEFVRDGHRIAVAFPWCRDTERKDGVACDRSPAVYAHPRVILSPLLGELLQEISTALAEKIEQMAA